MGRKSTLEIVGPGAKHYSIDAPNPLTQAEEFEPHGFVLHQQAGDLPLQVFDAWAARLRERSVAGQRGAIGFVFVFYVHCGSYALLTRWVSVASVTLRDCFTF